MPSPAAAAPAIDPDRWAALLDAISARLSPRGSLVANALTLAASLAVFVGLDLVRMNTGLRDVALLVLVLLLHEAGHYLAMRHFRYAGVRMFFIPLLGAAVQGYKPTAAAWQRAVVTLAGPAPGIVLACGLFAVHAVSPDPFLYQVAVLLWVLDFFNLLPIYPLDGGRLLYDLFACRAAALELAIVGLGGLGLTVIGLALGAWIMAIVGVLLLLVGVPITRRQVRLVRQWGPQMAACRVDSPLDLPRPLLEQVILAVEAAMPGHERKSRDVAAWLCLVWERAVIQPAGARVAAGFTAVYVAFWLLPLAVLVLGPMLASIWGAPSGN